MCTWMSCLLRVHGASSMHLPSMSDVVFKTACHVEKQTTGSRLISLTQNTVAIIHYSLLLYARSVSLAFLALSL